MLNVVQHGSLCECAVVRQIEHEVVPVSLVQLVGVSEDFMHGSVWMPVPIPTRRSDASVIHPLTDGGTEAQGV